MKKVLIFIIIIFLILGLLSAKNIILKLVLEKVVRAISGLRLSLGAIDVGLIKPFIKVERLILLNPDKFLNKTCFEIPLLYVEYDMASLFRNQIRLKDMVLELKELSVIKNTDGELNLNSLNIVKSSAKGRTKKMDLTLAMPAIRIDRLHLKVGRVIYKDYTQAPFPKIVEFNINLDERYEDISNPYALGSLIVARSLYRTSISRLTGFDLGTLEEKLEGIVIKGAGVIEKATEKVVGLSGGFTKEASKTIGEAKGALKSIITFPFGKKGKDE